MELDIKIGPTGLETHVVDRKTGYKFHPTRIELIVEARAIPTIRMDFEADDVTVEGENISTELGRVTILAGEKWAKLNGYKLVPDDGLDVELGRDDSADLT